MNKPKKVQLAFIPTPIQKINFEGNNFLIKRDDMTGFELTGNKVRKLEYLICQANKEKADYIFTEGGEQSNHARAAVIAASRFGIKSKIFLWGKDKSNPEGNLFLDKFFNSEIKFLNKKEYENVNDIMSEERQRFLKNGRKVFIIPGGGSTSLGIWGYISFIDELSRQIDLSKLNGIVTAAGSGGTAAGMMVGSSLLNLKLKIYAVNVIYPEDIIRKKILQTAEVCINDFRLNCKIKYENLKILDGFSTEGYKNISTDKLKLLKRFAHSSGIIFDPAYTGKAFKAYYDNFLSTNNGMKTLFLHTGGIFGVFNKQKKYLEA